MGRYLVEVRIALRHFDLRQTGGVEYVSLLDNSVAIQNKGRQSVHLFGCERPLSRADVGHTAGHGAVDEVPYGRGKRILHHTSFRSRQSGKLTFGFAVDTVAMSAPLFKNRCA